MWRGRIMYGMRTFDTLRGHKYVVTSPKGCTVTDAAGRKLVTVTPPVTQAEFWATGGLVSYDDDSGCIFKDATV